MTVDEKRRVLARYNCAGLPCNGCPAYREGGYCEISVQNLVDLSNARMHELYHLLIESGKANAEPSETTPEDVNHDHVNHPGASLMSRPLMSADVNHDPVNHPSHYCRDGAFESIDEMVAVFGVEAVKSFCLCNVWKYRYRAADKGGEEDLKKSDWYMRKYIELNKEEKHD